MEYVFNGFSLLWIKKAMMFDPGKQYRGIKTE